MRRMKMKKDEEKIPTVAMNAPKSPESLYPMKVAVIIMGSGVMQALSTIATTIVHTPLKRASMNQRSAF
jgi:hypothetical protein